MADIPQHDEASRRARVARLLGGRRWVPAGVAVLAALAVTLVVVLVAGDGGAPDAHRSPLASAGPQLTRDPSARPLSLPSQPLWRGGAGGSLSQVDGAQIAGDRVLLWGHTAAEDPEDIDDDLAVADVTTGRTLWIWHNGHSERTADGRWLFPDPRGGIHAVLIGTGADELVVTEYQLTGCRSDPFCSLSTTGSTNEEGLLALDAATGAVRWRVPVLPSVPASSPRVDQLLDSKLVLRAADARTAVIGIESAVRLDDWLTRSTVVIDVAARTVRWHRDGEWPLRLTGGTVLTERSLVADPDRHSGEDDDLGLAVDVTARDAATGGVRWHTAGRYRRAGLLAAAGGVALLWDATAATAATITAFSAPKADGRYEMVDVRTGRVRASMTAYTPSTLGDAQLPCADQEPPDPTTLACVVVPGGRAGSTQPQRLWTARSGQVTLSPPRHVRLTALQVADGYLLAGSPGFPYYQDGWTVLDRAGTTLARVGGTVLALDDGYAVVRTGQDFSTRYAVYHLDH